MHIFEHAVDLEGEELGDGPVHSFTVLRSRGPESEAKDTGGCTCGTLERAEGHLPQIGVTIDRYEIVQLLGEGGMAAVYKARHTDLGSYHAVKVVHVTSEETVQRLFAEGRVQAKLRHPNVVGVTDILQYNDAPVLVLEYVSGPSLEDWLGEHRATVDQALQLFRGIALGVGAAHALGVVHRDLKPANVLLARTNAGLVPKVTDFGLVKALFPEPGGRATRPGAAIGTPQYMAPEQIQDSGEVDERADLFALGCILFEMLTGTNPFAHDSQYDVFQAVLKGERPGLRELCPSVPPHVEATVDKLLAVDPDERVASVTELVSALYGHEVPTSGGSETPLFTLRRGEDDWDSNRPSLEEGPVPPMPPPSSAPPPSSLPEEAVARGASWVTTLSLVSASMSALGLAVTLLVAAVWMATGHRDLEVAAGGADGVRIGGQDGVPTARGLRFEGVAVGDVVIDWVIGTDCATPTCPGRACEPQCATGRQTVRLERGLGPYVTDLAVIPPARRVVQVRAPAEARVALGDRPPVVSERALFDAVPPGVYELVVETPECPDEARGCTARGDCPEGCRSVVEQVLIEALDGLKVVDTAWTPAAD